MDRLNNRGIIDGIMLTEKAKEELIEIILEKDKQVDELAAIDNFSVPIVKFHSTLSHNQWGR